VGRILVMGIFAKTFLYYAIGSLIVGAVMGIGFATNLGRRVSNAPLVSMQKLGTYIPLTLDGIDGALIAASTEPRPTIVYIHGRSANRTELMPLAGTLLNAGYNAVLWDAKSRQISYGPREIDQIRRIVTTLRNDPHVDPNRIFLIGFSLGAAMAIGAGAADTEGHIRGIVADSAYADLEGVASRYLTAFSIIPAPIAWPSKTVAFATAKAVHGIDFKTRNPADWAERVACPVLLIHGKADKRIPPHHSEAIFERLQSEKSLWLVDKAGHTKAFEINPSGYTEHVLGFLKK
jgi:dipeptidyl aminopeptidase/acylaminoacyl peptidase